MSQHTGKICDTFSQGNFGASVCQDAMNLACAQVRQQSRAHLMRLPFSRKSLFPPGQVVVGFIRQFPAMPLWALSQHQELEWQLSITFHYIFVTRVCYFGDSNIFQLYSSMEPSLEKETGWNVGACGPQSPCGLELEAAQEFLK